MNDRTNFVSDASAAPRRGTARRLERAQTTPETVHTTEHEPPKHGGGSDDGGGRPRAFVGRGSELDALEQGLGPSNEGCAFWISGAPGIGKTALLTRVLERCKERGIPVVWIDPQIDDVAPSSLLEAIPPPNPSGAGARRVVIVDDMDQARAVERWLACRFVGPGVTLLVAARGRPSAVWFEGNAAGLREIMLRPLGEADATALLALRGVPATRRAAAVRWAEGNPLLLAVACDGSDPATPGGPPSGDDTLLRIADRLCESLPSPAHRLGLAVVITSRATPYELLREVIGDDATAEPVFRWLRSLSTLEDTTLGLRPHALVRRACAARLLTHHPAECLAVQRAVRKYCDQRIATASDPIRFLRDRWFLDRDLPVMSQYLVSAEDEHFLLDHAGVADRPRITELTEEHQGKEAARIVGGWFDRSPGHFDVLRAQDESFAGYSFSIDLDRAELGAAAEDDPTLGAVAAYLRRIGWSHTPAAASGKTGRVLVYHSWSAEKTHQEPSPAATLIMSQMTRRLLLTPNVDIHFSVTDQPEFWLELIRYMGFDHDMAGSFALGGSVYTLIACDWRRITMVDYLERSSQAALAQRFEGATRTSASGSPSPPGELGDLLRKRLVELATQSRLSEREKQVLDLLILGRDNKEIGLVLGIAPRTAKFHQQRTLQKIGADSRLDIMRLLL